MLPTTSAAPTVAIPAKPVRDRLRIAIQKSGRLADPARELLSACGLSWRESRDRLFCYGESLPIDLLLVRDDDIPGLIADGVCDLGIFGRNVALEYDSARRAKGLDSSYSEWRALGFGACRLDIAVPQDFDWTGPEDVAGLRIATSYPNLLGDWLASERIDAEVVQLMGSVEIAPRLGQADVICDLVSSGGTLAANQLKPVHTMMQSEAVMVGPTHELDQTRAEIASQLMRRLDGALSARDGRLMLLRTDRSTLDAVLAELPQGQSPTVTAVEGGNEVAVQVLSRGAVSWQRLEDLKRAGANGIFVLPVEGMLA